MILILWPMWTGAGNTVNVMFTGGGESGTVAG